MNTPPTCKLNTIPDPPSPDPNPQSKPVLFTGVWQKKARQNETWMKTEKKKEERLRYAVEIAHHSITKPNRKIWLGTYNTPEEGAVAYDLASIKIKGKAPNLSIGDNGEILFPLAPDVKESIKKYVEEQITGHYEASSGNGTTSGSGAKKKAVRENDVASTSGSGAKKRGWRVKGNR